MKIFYRTLLSFAMYVKKKKNPLELNGSGMDMEVVENYDFIFITIARAMHLALRKTLYLACDSLLYFLLFSPPCDGTGGGGKAGKIRRVVAVVKATKTPPPRSVYGNEWQWRLERPVMY